MSGHDSWELAQPLSYEAYCALAVLLLYEFLITFAREVRLIWRGRVTGANVLFALNRYVMLVYCFLFLSPEYWNCSGNKTYQVEVAIFALQISLYAIWALFSALRVYAISGHHLPLAGATLILGLAPVVTNICFDVDHTWFDGPRGCTLVPRFNFHGILKFVAYERSCMIASDVLVLAVIWYNVYEARGIIEWSTARLSTLLLRDGTIYFLILLILNVLQIISWATESFSAMAYPAQIATSILISRFLLNLRQGNDSSPDLQTDQTLLENMALTSRIIGNIGAELDHGSPWASRLPAEEDTLADTFELASGEDFECERPQVVERSLPLQEQV